MVLVPQVDERMRFELHQVKGHLNKAVEAAIMFANELLEKHAQRIDDEVSDLSPGKGSSYGQNVSVFFCCVVYLRAYIYRQRRIVTHIFTSSSVYPSS